MGEAKFVAGNVVFLGMIMIGIVMALVMPKLYSYHIGVIVIGVALVMAGFVGAYIMLATHNVTYLYGWFDEQNVIPKEISTTTTSDSGTLGEILTTSRTNGNALENIVSTQKTMVEILERIEKKLD